MTHNEGDPSSGKRPWWRLHVTTLLALAVVGSAVGYCESQRHILISSFDEREYGWPMRCLNELGMGPWSYDSVPRTGSIWRSDVPAAVLDFAAVVVVLISTAVTCEIWRRRKLAWWQFTVRSFFILTAVGAVVATLYSNRISIAWWQSALHTQGQTIYRCGLSNPWEPTPWHAAGAMLLGIGCVVFAAGWAAWNVVAVIWRMVRRRASVDKT